MMVKYQTVSKSSRLSDSENMGDYHDYYLKNDALFMAADFEKFMDTCLKYYGLDPCHYFSSPGLNWDAMLKMTGVKLEKNISH